MAAMMVGTALAGSLAILAAPAKAADECGPDAATVTCAPGSYGSVTYTGVIGPLNIVLPTGVTVTGGGVQNSGSGNLAVNAANGVSIGGSVGVNTSNGTGTVKVDEVSSAVSGSAAIVVMAAGDAVVEANSTKTTGANVGVGVIWATSGAGDVTIRSGTSSASGSGSGLAYAVHGSASLGTVSITSQDARIGSQAGIAVGGFGGEAVTIDSGYASSTGVSYGDGVFSSRSIAVYGYSTGGLVTIASDEARVTGAGALAIYASGAGGVVIDSGIASSTGGELMGGGVTYSTAAMSADSSAGDISVTSDNASATGIAGGGIFMRAPAGSIVIDSGTISTTGPGGYGISAIAKDEVTITSDAITTVGASILRPNIHGNDVGSNHAGAMGIEAVSLSSMATVTSGEIDTQGDGAAGIEATGALGVTIHSGRITTAGNTIDLPGREFEASAIDAESDLGPIVIVSEEAVTAGSRAHGIHADTGGTVDIDSGEIATAGQASHGIYVTAGGEIAIDSSSVTVTGAQASAIMVQGDANIGIVSQSASASGESAPLASASAIRVDSSSGNIDIDSGVARTGGAGAPGIWANAGAGAVRITSDDVKTTGAGALAILAYGRDGVVIDSGLAVSTAGSAYTGLLTFTSGGIAAISVGGEVEITSQTASATGDGAFGISGEGRDGVVIDSGTVTTTGGLFVDSSDLGHSSFGIAANSELGDIDITSVSVSTQGEAAPGIYARAPAGKIAIDSGSVATLGDGSAGITAIGEGDVTVTADSTTTQGDAITIGEIYGADPTVTIVRSDAIEAISRESAVSIVSGTVSTYGAGARGIFADAQGAVTIAAQETSTSGGWTELNGERQRADAIFARSATGPVSVTSDAIETAGDYAGAIQVYTPGQVSIDSGEVTTTGLGARGILAASTAGGSITIVSDEVSTSGGIAGNGDSSDAIVASTTGAVTITSGFATATGAGADAIWAQGGSVTINSGAASATGAGASGVFAISEGAITINVTGNVTSASAYGVFAAGASHRITVDVAAGKTVSGGIAGIDAESAAGAAVTNAGVVTQTGTDPDEDDGIGYAAISLAADGVPAGSTLSNSGSILAKNAAGIAVLFDSGDDTLNLLAGSTIVGRVLGGDGTDTINLSGSSSAKSAQQVFGGLYGFETLNLDAGYWTMNGVVQTDTVNIAAGAALEIFGRLDVNEAFFDPSGDVLTVNVGGRLLVDSDDGALYADAGDLMLTGTGNIDLKGGVQLHAARAWTNTGTLTIFTGSKLLVTGSVAGDVVVDAGGSLQIGAALAADPGDADKLVVTGPGTTGMVTGDMHIDGALTLNRSNDVTLTGDVSGTGDIYLTGGGVVTVANLYAFDGTTHIEAGRLKLLSVDSDGEFNVGVGAVIDLSGGDHTLGGLSGQGGIIVNDGSLTIAQGPGQTSIFAGSISGDGNLNVTGGGVLDLTGDNAYAGDTVVTGGSTFKVNGSITSDVYLSDGGTLGGSGEIEGAVNVGAGGVFSPGNSPGVTTVSNDVTFAAGSTYAFEVDNSATPVNDLIQITAGQAIINGGTLAVQAAGAADDYQRRTVYTAITAEAGLTGSGFSAVTSSKAFLTPYLSYGTGTVDVIAINNTISLATVGTTPNQIATAGAINAAGPGAALYDAVAPQDDAGVRLAANALSGEAFATQNAVLMQQATSLRRTLEARLAEPADGDGVWGEAFDRAGEIEAQDGLSAADTDARGLLAGFEGDLGAWRAGASVGFVQSALDSVTLGSELRTDSFELGAYAGTQIGAWRFSLSGAYGSHELNSHRTIAAVGLLQTVEADYHATSAQVFAEVAYGLTVGPVRIEPFTGLGAVSLETDGFVEAGNEAALTVAGQSQGATVAIAGVRLAAAGAFSPWASAAWRTANGDTQGVSTHRFGAGPAFTVRGADLLDEAVELGVGLNWNSDPFSVGFSYNGEIGDGVDQHGATFKAAVRF